MIRFDLSFTSNKTIQSCGMPSYQNQKKVTVDDEDGDGSKGDDKDDISVVECASQDDEDENIQPIRRYAPVVKFKSSLTTTELNETRLF